MGLGAPCKRDECKFIHVPATDLTKNQVLSFVNSLSVHKKSTMGTEIEATARSNSLLNLRNDEHSTPPFAVVQRSNLKIITVGVSLYRFPVQVGLPRKLVICVL